MSSMLRKKVPFKIPPSQIIAEFKGTAETFREFMNLKELLDVLVNCFRIFFLKEGEVKFGSE